MSRMGRLGLLAFPLRQAWRAQSVPTEDRRLHYPLSTLPLRGVQLAAQTGQRTLPLARPAAIPSHDASRHARLAPSTEQGAPGACSLAQSGNNDAETHSCITAPSGNPRALRSEEHTSELQ